MTRRRLLVSGVVVLVVSLIAGGVLLVLAARQVASAIDDMARAPVGCETTLSFTETGTFWAFVETRGSSSGTAGGACELPESWDLSTPPQVDLTLTDASGAGIALVPDPSLDYGVGGSAGTSVASFEIDEPGEYVLRVQSGEAGFAVAVGRNPDDAGLVLGVIALAVAGVGAIVALVLVVKGARRKPPRTAVPPPGAVWRLGMPVPGAPAGSTAPPPPPMWTPPPPAPPAAPPAGGPSSWAPPGWQPPEPTVRDDA